jgi:hypothetical protein
VLTLWSRAWEPRFAIGGLICGLGYVASLNILNPDALVAKRNIQRWQDTGHLDANALCGLSHDAKNLLVPLASKLQDRDSRQAINTWIASHSKPIKTWQRWHWAKNS